MWIWRGGEDVLFKEALFFTGAAFVTFGGAYVVLSYVADVAVSHYGWLTADQMVQGLGLAESTPGPLIMVTQYVGFIGAWNDPGPFAPLLYGTLEALVTTYATFLPCFLFIFLLEGLDDDLLKELRSRAVPQPFGTYTQPLRLKNSVREELTKVAILCSFSLDQVKEMIARDEPMFRELVGPTWQFLELPTGHWPMFSRPEDLANMLLDSPIE